MLLNLSELIGKHSLKIKGDAANRVDHLADGGQQADSALGFRRRCPGAVVGAVVCLGWPRSVG